MIPLNEQKRIIRDHQQATPVEMIPLAEAFGIEVFKASNWDDELSGFIRRNPAAPENFQIFVNAKHSLNRRRFTIAHEIAHALLHPFEIGDGLSEDALLRSGLPELIEYQANKFAADLLMPKHLLDPIIEEGERDVGRLAEKFNVSPQAMAIRLGVPQD